MDRRRQRVAVVRGEHDTVHVAIDEVVHDGDLAGEIGFERRAVPVDVNPDLFSLRRRARVYGLPEGVRLALGDHGVERSLAPPAGEHNKSQTHHRDTETQRTAGDEWRVTSDDRTQGRPLLLRPFTLILRFSVSLCLCGEEPCGPSHERVSTPLM